jgi:hypothetical protein
VTESVQRSTNTTEYPKKRRFDATGSRTARTGLELEGSILKLGADRGAQIHRNGLILPGKLPFDVWRQIGTEICLVTNSCAWWIGDWLAYGENYFGDRYEQAIADTSLDYQTLRNYAWIARKFTRSRRRDSLSFGHHAEVAALTETEQDKWLARAERFSWSRNELRRRIRAAHLADRPQSPHEGGTEIKVLKIDVPTQRLDQWRKAAERMNCSVAEWIVTILDTASTAQHIPRPQKAN